MEMESQWQQLMGASKEGKAAIVAKMTPEQARAHLRRLDAAPGNDPAAHAALVGKAGNGPKVFRPGSQLRRRNPDGTYA